MTDLPQGWLRTSLGEIGKWSSGGTPSRRNAAFFGKGIPWVKSGDLTDGPIKQTEEELTELGLNKSAAKLMPPGTISIALYGATIGKLGILTFQAATNQACANVVPDTRLIDPRYLFFYLMSERETFVDKGQGGAQPNISQQIVKAHDLLLAPLNEQRRIVMKLDELLNRVNSAQERLATIPHLLKRFRQSVLAAACSGALTTDWRVERRVTEPATTFLKRFDEQRKRQIIADNKKPNYLNYSLADCENVESLPSTWIRVPVGFLCDCIVPGRDKPRSFTGSIPWITLPDITSQEIRHSSTGLMLTELEIQEVNARIIPENAVVMSCVGRFGIAAIVKKPVVVNQQLHGFLQSDAILPEYLLYSIKAATQYMQGLATSTTIAYLNKNNCNSLPINLPPVVEQQEIVRSVEALFKTADALEARYVKAKAHVDKLTRSILAKAFRG